MCTIFMFVCVVDVLAKKFYLGLRVICFVGYDSSVHDFLLYNSSSQVTAMLFPTSSLVVLGVAAAAVVPASLGVIPHGMGISLAQVWCNYSAV